MDPAISSASAPSQNASYSDIRISASGISLEESLNLPTMTSIESMLSSNARSSATSSPQMAQSLSSSDSNSPPQASSKAEQKKRERLVPKPDRRGGRNKPIFVPHSSSGNAMLSKGDEKANAEPPKLYATFPEEDDGPFELLSKINLVQKITLVSFLRHRRRRTKKKDKTRFDMVMVKQRKFPAKAKCEVVKSVSGIPQSATCKIVHSRMASAVSLSPVASVISYELDHGPEGLYPGTQVLSHYTAGEKDLTADFLRADGESVLAGFVTCPKEIEEALEAEEKAVCASEVNIALGRTSNERGSATGASSSITMSNEPVNYPKRSSSLIAMKELPALMRRSHSHQLADVPLFQFAEPRTPPASRRRSPRHREKRFSPTTSQSSEGSIPSNTAENSKQEKDDVIVTVEEPEGHLISNDAEQASVKLDLFQRSLQQAFTFMSF